jgi:hypothetical protein
LINIKNNHSKLVFLYDGEENQKGKSTNKENYVNILNIN